ncbi:UNVERIFIED_CONTAM: hypothetical protein Slati_4532300 [Sesamum latifolium]|uniref:Uncharacterized protein n=1 Tax=Sesamum latifolium TaxID=2727402 RepID=A0AAW2SG97_9LAMI
MKDPAHFWFSSNQWETCISGDSDMGLPSKLPGCSEIDRPIYLRGNEGPGPWETTSSCSGCCYRKMVRNGMMKGRVPPRCQLDMN